MLPDRADLRAGFFFRTVATDFETFSCCALANLAQRVAKHVLTPFIIHSAALAVQPTDGNQSFR